MHTWHWIPGTGGPTNSALGQGRCCRRVQTFEVLSSPSAESTSLTLPGPWLLFQLVNTSLLTWQDFCMEQNDPLHSSPKNTFVQHLWWDAFYVLVYLACTSITYFNLPVVYTVTSISSFPYLLKCEVEFSLFKNIYLSLYGHFCRIMWNNLNTFIIGWHTLLVQRFVLSFS